MLSYDPPPSGITAECGRRVQMEDNHTRQPHLIDTLEIPLNFQPRFPYGMEAKDIKALSQIPSEDQQSQVQRCRREVLHFYAVYDGHGGPEAAAHCQTRMHENIREAWNNLSTRGGARSDSPQATRPLGGKRQHQNGLATSESIAEMFQSAFKMTDEEYPQPDSAPLIGTTAVVALVGLRSLFISYCGNSKNPSNHLFHFCVS